MSFSKFISANKFLWFDIEEYHVIQADCHDTIALQLLLKLKRHLKIIYSLNDARCQVCFLYSPHVDLIINIETARC